MCGAPEAGMLADARSEVKVTSELGRLEQGPELSRSFLLGRAPPVGEHPSQRLVEGRGAGRDLAEGSIPAASWRGRVGRLDSPIGAAQGGSPTSPRSADPWIRPNLGAPLKAAVR